MSLSLTVNLCWTTKDKAPRMIAIWNKASSEQQLSRFTKMHHLAPFVQKTSPPFQEPQAVPVRRTITTSTCRSLQKRILRIPASRVINHDDMPKLARVNSGGVHKAVLQLDDDDDKNKYRHHGQDHQEQIPTPWSGPSRTNTDTMVRTIKNKYRHHGQDHQEQIPTPWSGPSRTNTDTMVRTIKNKYRHHGQDHQEQIPTPWSGPSRTNTDTMVRTIKNKYRHHGQDHQEQIPTPWSGPSRTNTDTMVRTIKNKYRHHGQDHYCTVAVKTDSCSDMENGDANSKNQAYP